MAKTTNLKARLVITGAEIESVRKRQIKNLLLTLFISRGVPMLLGGDEFRRTQRGNNNAYCQDNETSWYDWRYLEQHQDISRFARVMIALRRAHPILAREQFYTDAEIRWFNPSQGPPDWSNPHSRQLACLIHDGVGKALYLMFNAGTEAVTFCLPAPPCRGRWCLAVDTCQDTPPEAVVAGRERFVDSAQAYCVAPYSSVILLGVAGLV
jgi:glycogen operon protein